MKQSENQTLAERGIAFKNEIKMIKSKSQSCLWDLGST